ESHVGDRPVAGSRLIPGVLGAAPIAHRSAAVAVGALLVVGRPTRYTHSGHVSSEEQVGTWNLKCQ
ncbi:hypothetical protein ACJX0J_014773, partial [Zea mays]